MKVSSAVLVCALAAVLNGARTQAAAPCSNPIDRTLEFSVTSLRDTTGRWVSQVDIEHDQGDLESSPWTVDIKHNTAGCPGSPRVKVTAKLRPPTVKPSPGYELHQGFGYYKLHLGKKAWLEAKAVCESEGAHLAIINSEAESQVLLGILKQATVNVTGTWTFIGFHDMYREGQYLTVFDEPLANTGFSRWASTYQPDNYDGSSTNPGEDCGSIYYSNAGLNDLSCTAQVPFICEAPL